MRFSHFLILALIVISSFIARPGNATAAPDVGQALTTWKAAVESGKLKDVMKLYDKKAMMIPTFAQSPLTKYEQIQEYYKVVLANEGIHVEILESHPRIFGDIAIDDGRYELSYIQEGEEVSVPARFTFVYQLEGGKWLIIDHHASQMPDKREKK